MNQTGTVIGNELFVRCPFCGDSQNNLKKAHFSINTSQFVYHCFRCGISGKLSDAEVLSLVHELPNLNFIHQNKKPHSRLLADILAELNPGAGSPRESKLSRWHYGEDNADAFISRSATGKVVGVQVRFNHKKIKTYGISAFGFAEDTLLSTPTSPLRIIEGTYDVIYPKDVCVFGAINYGKLKSLVGHYVLLCPDGDIWQRPELFKAFHKTVKSLVLDYNGRGAWLTGIEYLSDGLDPDEVPKDERTFISVQNYLTTFRNT